MDRQTRSVIVSGARTPMGRLLGSLKDFSAAELGGIAIKAALERARIPGDQVDYVIMGQVLQAGAGRNPARPVPDATIHAPKRQRFTLRLVAATQRDGLVNVDLLTGMVAVRARGSRPRTTPRNKSSVSHAPDLHESVSSSTGGTR
jgi:hypothetical protein